jgi:hypothetical protein
MKTISPRWRGLTQLFAFTILPLTLLLLLVAFGSVTLHERDMRALVGERDERAVQSAAAALESELHHRAAIISLLSNSTDESQSNADLISDFDGGLAYFDSSGLIKTATLSPLWDWVAQNEANLPFADSAHPEAVFSSPILDPTSKQFFVIVSVYSPAQRILPVVRQRYFFSILRGVCFLSAVRLHLIVCPQTTLA